LLIKIEPKVPYALVVILVAILASTAHQAFKDLSSQEELKADLIKKQQERILELEEGMAVQDQELLLAKSQINAIEISLGLKQDVQVSLQTRLNLALKSSKDRAQMLKLIPSGSPVIYKGISSRYGYRKHPVTKRRALHRGTDLKANIGTPVYATADGIVESAHTVRGFGRLVELDHAYGFKSRYGHLSKIAVKKGSVLNKGDLIGYSGNSGISTGAHLHYEVSFVRQSLNPYWFIKWEQDNFDEIFAKVKRVTWDQISSDIALKDSDRFIVLSDSSD